MRQAGEEKGQKRRDAVNSVLSQNENSFQIKNNPRVIVIPKNYMVEFYNEDNELEVSKT